MNFTQAVQAQDAVTTNGMPALASTLDANVDLFFKIGASRGKNVLGEFSAALAENRELALRIAQWARDVRSGAGERQIYRDILGYLETKDPIAVQSLLRNTAEIGRWDDLLAIKNPLLKSFAFDLIRDALQAGNGLCAKWMPRKGKVAEELRAHLGFSPKRYRKTLVTLTQVVETQMCAKDWDNIEFGHVPSVAAARYKKAFKRNAEVKYTEYAEALSKGDAKINAGAVYPYDVLKGVFGSYRVMEQTERQVTVAQWAALPNYVGDSLVLPMVDVSGSMNCKAGGGNSKSDLTCLQVAISLGLYLADKNTGPFNGTFLTFSETPQLLTLEGDILEKYHQMQSSDWGMNTNLEKAFDQILEVAKASGLPQADMPKYVLILSDMQFDASTRGTPARAQTMIANQYKEAGYEVPKIVYWNLNAHDNVPVRFDEQGTALISGFSPSIMKSVLKAENFAPEHIMLEAVMKDRYAISD
jgi:hypothetical protein